MTPFGFCVWLLFCALILVLAVTLVGEDKKRAAFVFSVLVGVGLTAMRTGGVP